ncbi:MAG: hypothetical protein J6K96_02530 [Treponema sp.]|nr:hypothetical protein [Treponema sp.]
MKKILMIFMALILFGASAEAQESAEKDSSVFPQDSLQLIVHQDGLFSVNKFQFADGTKIKNRKELNAVLRTVPESQRLAKKAGFWRGMTWLSVAGAVGCAIGSLCFDEDSAASDNLLMASSVCIYSLFCFPVFEYSARNRAVDKYNLYVSGLNRAE